MCDRGAAWTLGANAACAGARCDCCLELCRLEVSCTTGDAGQGAGGRRCHDGCRAELHELWRDKLFSARSQTRYSRQQIQMIFRPYRSDDLAALFALDEACFEPPFRFSRAAMRRFAEAKKARVVIAEEDGLAGFCIVHVERVEGGRVGYVVTLDVAEQWRRKGLAGELMRRVEAEAHEAGCWAMVLHVFVGNDGAIRFYERCGY